MNSEWHNGVIDELSKFNPEWAGYAVLSYQSEAMRQLSSPINDMRQTIAEATRDMDMNAFVNAFAQEALVRDARVAANTGAAFNVTSLFEPLLAASGPSPGRTAHRAGHPCPRRRQSCRGRRLLSTASIQAARTHAASSMTLRSAPLLPDRVTPRFSRGLCFTSTFGNEQDVRASEAGSLRSSSMRWARRSAEAGGDQASRPNVSRRSARRIS